MPAAVPTILLPIRLRNRGGDGNVVGTLSGAANPNLGQELFAGSILAASVTRIGPAFAAISGFARSMPVGSTAHMLPDRRLQVQLRPDHPFQIAMGGDCARLYHAITGIAMAGRVIVPPMNDILGG